MAATPVVVAVTPAVGEWAVRESGSAASAFPVGAGWGGAAAAGAVAAKPQITKELSVGKPRSRSEDVAMAVAGVRWHRQRHFGVMPASFAACFMFS